MQTPIVDFIKKYTDSSPVRLHMPGHKGVSFLGAENCDITEIDGADELYHASGIIKQSEQNAGNLFGAHTFYSTEGSSLSIRAMLFLVVKYALSQQKKPIIATGRNAHKAFLSAAALLDFDIEWLCPENNSNYLSCNVTDKFLDEFLSNTKEKPCAIYLTSPDYLGNMSDIKALKKVCEKHNVLLLVDNAHGAYLNFLPASLHPISLGADLCCDSAHKTLPCLTGGAYLHVSKQADNFFIDNAKNALSLFGTTSPSYLILQSLDLTNAYLANDYHSKLSQTVKTVDKLKNSLTNHGYDLVGNEPLKITINTKKYGYLGCDFYSILFENNIVAEFYDQDFIVFMVTPETTKIELELLEKTLCSIKKLPTISVFPPEFHLPQKKTSVRMATFSPSETLPIKECVGKVLAEISVACPPAIPLIVSGEVIDKKVIEHLEYYGVKNCKIVK